MNDDGFYYLHTNGSLIWKRFRPDTGDFVKRIWAVDSSDRMSVWVIAVEALALGALRSRIMELRDKWGLSDEDAQEFANRAKLKLFKDGDQWCVANHDFVNLQESQAGFGETALDALAAFAKKGLLSRVSA